MMFPSSWWYYYSLGYHESAVFVFYDFYETFRRSLHLEEVGLPDPLTRGSSGQASQSSQWPSWDLKQQKTCTIRRAETESSLVLDLKGHSKKWQETENMNRGLIRHVRNVICIISCRNGIWITRSFCWFPFLRYHSMTNGDYEPREREREHLCTYNPIHPLSQATGP